MPLWGQRLKRRLPSAQYLELVPAGHCPHHEAPAAINTIIQTWVAAVEDGKHQEHHLMQVSGATGKKFTSSNSLHLHTRLNVTGILIGKFPFFPFLFLLLFCFIITIGRPQMQATT